MRALREALSADRKPDAVFITEREDDSPGDAISLTKSQSTAPVILFRRSHGDLGDGSFDLVIESLTPPTQWLREIDELIARHHSGRRGDPGHLNSPSDPPTRFDAQA